MRTIILLFSLVVFGSVHAQTQLANDQNPNYLVGQQKYLQLNDSMQAYMNVTEQNTYKAYDWYEAKMERKIVLALVSKFVSTVRYTVTTTGTMVGTTIILGTTILEIEIVGTITMDFFQDL